MRKKAMWFMIVVGGLVADFVLPFWWAFFAVIPITIASWWVAYKSGWMDGLD